MNESCQPELIGYILAIPEKEAKCNLGLENQAESDIVRDSLPSEASGQGGGREAEVG